MEFSSEYFTETLLYLLLLRALLLAFVLFQSKHTSHAENGENLISAQPRISVHLE